MEYLVRPVAYQIAFMEIAKSREALGVRQRASLALYPKEGAKRMKLSCKFCIPTVAGSLITGFAQ
jgi:hypothetical protein